MSRVKDAGHALLRGVRDWPGVGACVLAYAGTAAALYQHPEVQLYGAAGCGGHGRRLVCLAGADLGSQPQTEEGEAKPMKVVVCVKQVQVLGDEVELTSDRRDVDPNLLEPALNEWDACATEEALRIRGRAGGGEVVVITVGGEDTEEAVRRCLAMGADQGIRVEARSAGFLDPITIAHAMAGPVREERPDLAPAWPALTDHERGRIRVEHSPGRRSPVTRTSSR